MSKFFRSKLRLPLVLFLAQPSGFYTTARWSLVCCGSRLSLTGDLMNRARSV